MLSRPVPTTGRELLAEIDEEADRVVIPRDLRERRAQYALQRVQSASVVVPIYRAPAPEVVAEAIELARRRTM